ncbi:MAG: hypothetical protein AB1762_19430 [Gemmatimonadota bacterium]
MRLFTLCLITAVLPALAHAQGDDNAMELTLGSGPHRGTYKLTPFDVVCVHFKEKKQFGVAYYDSTARDAKRLHRLTVNIPQTTNSGPQTGHINAMFGEAKGKPIAEYRVSVPTESKGPLTMTTKGKVVSVAFEGSTKSGVPLRISATCRTIDEF